MATRRNNADAGDEMDALACSKAGESEPAQEEQLQPPELAESDVVCSGGDRAVDTSKHEKSDVRLRLRVITKTISAPPEPLASAPAEDERRHPGFGIERGTLELVRVARKEWSQPQSLPLPLAPFKHAPIISEFTRPWSALRLKPQPSESLPRGRATELPRDQSLLKNYEPRFSVGERTFPSSEVTTPSFFDPRVAVDDALALLVTVNLRFALGSIEPLFCRLMVYDVSLGCRVTEEFSFTLPGAVDPSGNVVRMGDAAAAAASRAPPALLYVLPNHLPQHLYLVLKVSKVLSGDGESATASYCSPEKLASESEQSKLIEKAADCARRLGRYRQPLAWGAIALQEGASRCMTMYRQRATMSDEQRLPLISDAVRGAVKEKVVPSVCEVDLEPIDDQRLADSKFQSSGKSRSLPKNPLPSTPVLEILDPFFSGSAERAAASAPPPPPIKEESALPTTHRTSTTTVASEGSQCREVQPFCHPSVASAFGLTGSGPVAVAYVNALYLYPIHLEKFQFRNIAIRIQLLEFEAPAVCALDDVDAPSSVLKAIYGANHEARASAFTLVNYHQKNPQFENEFKICLPECLTLEHHVLFSFYHVHCKKLLPTQPQQELVGYAVLPILQKDGTVLQDNNYVVNVVPVPPPSKTSTPVQSVSLPPGYVAAARNAGLDIAKTTLACRTRVLSSLHSQDRVVATFLHRFHSKPLTTDLQGSAVATAAEDDDVVVSKLLKLRQASMTNVRFFLLPLAKCVLGYLHFGSAVVRWAAFRAFLSVLEKASWTPHRSLKQDLNQILHHFVHLVFDESAVENPGGVAASTASGEGRRPHAIFDALLREWLLVLQDNSPVEDNIETKRLSLAYSNILLQLTLKSMAMHTQPTPSVYDPNRMTGSSPLPLLLSGDDEELTESVLRELIHSVGSNVNGLLLQKEVNRSVAYFCRGLFLVARNQVPARIIARYMQWAAANQSDANVLVHLMFPFVRILVDFEFFAVVNGARALSSSSSLMSRSRRASSEPPLARVAVVRPSPWLAQLVFEQLLCVADEQKEEKIRCDAMRLLRRMFVAQAYNAYHQSPEDQETIALIYYPFIASVAQFTADGKLLCSSGTSTLATPSGAPDANDKSQELKKELLICVVHLLSSVSTRFLSRFFQQVDDGTTRDDLQPHGGARASPSAAFPLSPTGSLMHYRRIVEERKHESAGRNRRSILKITGHERRAHVAGESPEQGGAAPEEQAYDEVRVHACLALVRHIIETFLVDETSLAPGVVLWHHLLSPDLVTREGRLSLLDIEMHLNHRRISRQQVSMDAFSAAGSVATASSSSHASGRSSGTASVGSTWSPSPKMPRTGSSSSLGAPASPGNPRVQINRSLPRNWGKAYAGGGARRTSASLSGDGGRAVSPPAPSTSTRSSESQRGDDDEPESYELQIRYIHRITAVTSLRSLRTAVDQFEWVIRLIEVPFDCARQDRGEPQEPANVDGGAVSVEQAYALLGALIDLVFLLLRRANAIETLSSNFDGDIEESDDEDGEDEDRDQCFLTDLFEYLQSFVTRFQRALFACRIVELPLLHDRCRVETLLSIAATGKMLVVRQHAAKLLGSLVALCYAQTGSFSLVKRPIDQVLCGVFFASPAVMPTSTPIPTECLRDAIEEMRQCALADESVTPAFVIQFQEALNALLTQIKVFEMWQAAVASPEQLRDVEEIEEGLYRVARAISPFWLLEEKKQWLDALLGLHLARGRFAEAACCKLEAVAFAREVVEDAQRGEFLFWEVRELVAARELAERAEWPEQQIMLSELLLARLKEQRRFPEYLETLRYLERVVSQYADADALQGSGSGTSHAFYRVTYAGDCVSAHTARREFIYKRSKFLSLGEFVGEMKATLRAKYATCERVDVVPEAKALVGDEPNVIFMRVTSVDVAAEPPTEFTFALPFTLGGRSAYGRTREQMKRVTHLSVAQPFPCALSRQVVTARREELRCPIDNSMDDVLKRCVLLQAEVDKELRGRTDLKTLTLVLKGSVDTHVHGGVPEVVDSFLAAGDADADALPTLLDARGAPMGGDESAQKRLQLANLLARFLKLCWQCLLISREAFRRAQSSSAATAAAPAALLSPSALESSRECASPSSFARNAPFLSPTAASAAAAAGSARSGSLAFDDDAPLSPLQVEFERSFAALVELVQRRVPLPHESAGDVALLVQQMQGRRMGSVAPGGGSGAS